MSSSVLTSIRKVHSHRKGTAKIVNRVRENAQARAFLLQKAQEENRRLEYSMRAHLENYAQFFEEI